MTAVAVDPRIRKRRAQVRRAQGRRRLHRLLFLLALVSLVVMVWLTLRSPLMAVDTVGYEGLVRTPLAEIEAASGITVGQPLIDVDTAAVTRRVEALPWVADANVSRSWTGSVVIEVTERQPAAAALAAPDVWVLVDSEGRVLTGAVEVPPGLPRITGVLSAGAPGTSLAADSGPLLEVAALAPAVLRPRIQGLYLESDGEIWMALDTGERVLLGPDSDLAFKVMAAATMVQRLDVEGRSGWELDVTVPSLPVVRDLRERYRTAVEPAEDTAAADRGSLSEGQAVGTVDP